MEEEILKLENYALSFFTPQGEVEAVRGINLSVKKGEILCIVGESGCGKSVLCRSIIKLLPEKAPHGARIKRGKVFLDGQDITAYTEKQMRSIRGNLLSMVFQDPMMTLNPTMSVGCQIMESILQHKKMTNAEAKKRAIEMLKLVGIEEPEKRFSLQPHFFSGGMRQRCVLAVALALSPKLLLADEPTTALDVTVESKILDLLVKLCKTIGVSLVLVSHDLGVVARIADRVAVMYAGKSWKLAQQRKCIMTLDTPIPGACYLHYLLMQMNRVKCLAFPGCLLICLILPRAMLLRSVIGMLWRLITRKCLPCLKLQILIMQLPGSWTKEPLMWANRMYWGSVK